LNNRGDYTPFFDILTGREGGYSAIGGVAPCQRGVMVGGVIHKLPPPPCG